MTTIEVIKNADRITFVNAYDDGTYLWDVLVGDKVYTIRQKPELLSQYTLKPKTGDK